MTREVNAPGGEVAGTIPLATPDLTQAETQAVMEAMESGFVSSVGPAVDAFETEFAALVGRRYAVACASGTAALHIALLVVGVRASDEVLCSDFTFIGSSNPIAYLGAQTTFLDSETRTWNMDPELLVSELDRRAASGDPMPAAVELVHVLGQPADVHPILSACDRHGIPIIEDAAESLGAGWSQGPLKGRLTGAVGTIGCFSFNGNKIVTAGGGGMIVTDDESLARRARHLTTQAKVPDVGYLHDEVGYNYRLTNLAAALGLAQLRRLPELVANKRAIAERYDAAFKRLPLTLPPRLAGYDSTYWLYSVLTEDQHARDALLVHLQNHGVGARALWRPLHEQPPFSRAPTIGGAVANSLFARGVSLPCSSHLDLKDQDHVIQSVLNFFG